MVFLVCFDLYHCTRETCVSVTHPQTWPRATRTQLKFLFVLTTSINLHDYFVQFCCVAERENKYVSDFYFELVKLIKICDLHVLVFNSCGFAGATRVVSANPPCLLPLALLLIAFIVFLESTAFFWLTLNACGLMVPDGPLGGVTLLDFDCVGTGENSGSRTKNHRNYKNASNKKKPN